MTLTFRAGASLILLGVLLSFVDLSAAQDLVTVGAQRVEEDVSVDGRLDEAAWGQAPVASGFRQFEPTEGASASQTTEVRILYGPGALYVGALMRDDRPEAIVATLGRRDRFNQADWFTVSFDSNDNQETAYTFAVNAAGIQMDGLRTGSGGGGGSRIDESWDAVWESDVSLTPEGWIAELRIPYSMLRFSEGVPQWRVHFQRRIPRLGEESEWPLVPRSERENMLARYGVLTGLDGVDPQRNVQVRPYLMSRLNSSENGHRPGSAVHSTAADVGGDVKIGLTSNVTLDATVNPDFGQIESDPAQLNLSAFETFFQERRPFFLEGSEIYQFGMGRGSDLLYTRRIGGQAPIVGAAKLSGRTESGTSFGFLGAATGDDFTPTRYFAVTRARSKVGEFSTVGGIVTGFADPVGTEDERSLAGGADWDLRLLDNRYGVSGYLAFTRGTAVQSGSEAQTGLAGFIQAEKRSGSWRYDVDATVFDEKFDPNDLGRNRQNNYVDLGGSLRHEFNGGQSVGPFQRGGFFSFVGQRWSYLDRINQGLRVGLRSNWVLRGFQDVGLGLDGRNLNGGYDLFETRGLGPALQARRVGARLDFRTDSRRSWDVRPEVGVSTYSAGGTEYEAGLSTEMTVGTRFSFDVSVEGAWERGVRSWSSNDAFRPTEDGGWAIGTVRGTPDQLDRTDYRSFVANGRLDEIFAGLTPYSGTDAYYVPVYGARDTREMDVVLRSDVTFTPDLSLQLYSQVFVARGRYEDFRVLRDAETYQRFDGYPKRDEFTLQSFQLNTVLRWEYRPGSTFFLVWTQSRRADRALNPLADPIQSPYGVPLGEQFAETFGLFPNNTLLVKMVYTFLR